MRNKNNCRSTVKCYDFTWKRAVKRSGIIFGRLVGLSLVRMSTKRLPQPLITTPSRTVRTVRHINTGDGTLGMDAYLNHQTISPLLRRECLGRIRRKTTYSGQCLKAFILVLGCLRLGKEDTAALV
ncbi:hypothetical protein TNCV_4222121 [Trichonephila clavipes]|nr:hypothetical protein TNCV_4222121 [Trichonephila clavipes]